MSVAYIDTSGLVAVAFQDQGGPAIAERLNGFSHLISSNLLEAELRAAFAREGCGFDGRLVSMVEWILPDRPLTPKITAALQADYPRGADLWHVATALYVAPEPSEFSFITLDGRQRAVAEALGFQT